MIINVTIVIEAHQILEIAMKIAYVLFLNNSFFELGNQIIDGVEQRQVQITKSITDCKHKFIIVFTIIYLD